MADNSAYRTYLLDIPQTDVVVQAIDIAGTGSTKTVTVHLRDIRARFTDRCCTLAAVLRLAIVFDSGGEDLSSANTCEVVIEIDRPSSYPRYSY